jgi:hypothetical protein
MLALMLDSHFQNMLLVTMYLGQENVVAFVVDYDNELFLTLLIEVAKLLMFFNGAKFENLFFTTTTM